MEVDRVVYAPDGKPAARLAGPLEEAARYASEHRLHLVVWLLPGSLRGFDSTSLDGKEIVCAAPDFRLRRDVRRLRTAPRLQFEVFTFADEASVSAYREWKAAA